MAIVALGVPLALSFGARVNAEVRSQALSQADLVAATAADLLAPALKSNELRILVQTTSGSIRGRVIVVGAVRVTESVTAVNNAVRRTTLAVALIGLVVLAFGLSAGAFIAGQIRATPATLGARGPPNRRRRSDGTRRS